MPFSDVKDRLDEDNQVLDALKKSKVDLLTISKLENMMVRDLLIVMYTAYQELIVEAVLKKVKRHSNNHEAIVNFVRRKIEETNIDTFALKKLLMQLLPSYASNFEIALEDRETTSAYMNIITGRINVAHYQGNNLQIASLVEIEEAHNLAQRLLQSFENCMYK